MGLEYDLRSFSRAGGDAVCGRLLCSRIVLPDDLLCVVMPFISVHLTKPISHFFKHFCHLFCSVDSQKLMSRCLEWTRA